jgi:hypothetical protein
LPELFRVAGARLIFDQQGMAELAALIEDQIVAFAAGERTSG